MKVVYKYPIEQIPEQSVIMPQGAEILSFQNQRDEPCLWALVDNEQPNETRNFYVIGTGHTVPADFASVKFIGTAQFMDGLLVIHLFEKL